MICRHCGSPATRACYSGLEWHPVCDDCALYWNPSRIGPLAEVAADYEYEHVGGSASG